MISSSQDHQPPIQRAVVLAAGRGKRMGAWTDHLPKPLVPVAGRPLILRLLDGLKAAGLVHIEIVTGYMADVLESEIRHELGSQPGEVEVGFHRQGGLAGTAAALLACQDACANEPFLLTWGDVLVRATDYRAVLTAFRDSRWDHVLGINEVDDPTAGAAIELAPDGSVRSLVEKPPAGSSATRWNNAGVFAFAPVVFEYARRVPTSSRGERELPTAIASMIEDGERIGACRLEGWQHVGTPEELARANDAVP